MTTPRNARLLIPCEGCGTLCEQRNSRRRFCSGKCRAAAWQARHVRLPATEGRGLRALLKETLDRVSQIRHETDAMLARLWEAQTALEKYLGQG